MQLHFGTPLGTSSSSLSTCFFSGEEERCCEEMVKFVVSVELLLSIVDNKNFTKFVQNYIKSTYDAIVKTLFTLIAFIISLEQKTS